MFIWQCSCMSSFVHQCLDLEHISDFGTFASIVNWSAIISSLQLLSNCSWFAILFGRSSWFSWSLRLLQKSVQSMSQKLWKLDVGAVGVDMLSCIIMGRWSVLTLWKCVSVLQTSTRSRECSNMNTWSRHDHFS